jgi:glycosyltransferase involved in cell wall biosynthesis
MFNLSIIICTHKAPIIINSTIESIISQNDITMVELVIVNNGFSFEREQELHKILNGKISYTIVHEPAPGLGPARRKGFASAQGDYFILLDDDNTLAPGFVETLIGLIKQYPELGGVCPIVEPVWEVTPPEWLQDFGRLCLSYNACGRFRPQFTEKYWAPHEVTECLRPPGGGMVIRREVALHYLETVNDPNRIALARQPNSLVGCEDLDIFSGVADLGLGVVFSDSLKVYHHIPKIRITAGYLTRLNYQMIRSFGMLCAMKSKESYFRYSIKALFYFIQEIKSILIVFIKHNNKPLLQFFLEITRVLGLFIGKISLKVR